jgi:signal transduction histidine kinase
MYKTIRTAFLILLAALGTSSALAGNAIQAKALLNKAVSYYHQHGSENTFAQINEADGRFRQGELYVFVFDGQGTIVAHGADSSLVGTNRMDLQDENGKLFVKEILDLGEGGGTVNYVWMNPESGKVEPKTSFISRVGEYRFGCGVYD